MIWVFDIHRLFVAIVLAAIRIAAAMALCPALNESMIGGTARRCAVVAFSLMVVPALVAEMPPGEPAMPLLVLIGVKEALIGSVIGFFSAVPFWIAENVGNLIDNQRGATMGEVYSPLSGAQVSTTGIFFTQVVSTIFFVSGAIFLVLAALYRSYEIWPVFAGYPALAPDADEQALGMLGEMLRQTVVISSPIIILMFLATVGLGFVNRTAPQLNVFFLSMPIKSALGVAMLVIYLRYILDMLMYTDSKAILAPAMRLMGGG